MSALETKVEELKASVESLKTKVVAHEQQQDATVAALQKTVDELKASGDVSAAITALDAIKADVDGFDPDAAAAAATTPPTA